MRIIIALFLTLDEWMDRQGDWANILFGSLFFGGFFAFLAYLVFTV